MSGGHYENMGLLSGNKPTGIRVQGGMTNKSNSKPVVTPTGAAPTAPSTAPATAAPLPALSQITEQNGTQIVSIPVRHQWNANLKDPPSVLPLEKVLAKLGHNGNDAHVSKIVLKETHSNAPSTLKATVAGVLPTDVNKPLHTIDALRDTEGNAFTYIVPPGKTEHNKVLLDNPLPPATDAVDFKDHVQINQKDLTKNVIDLPFVAELIAVRPEEREWEASIVPLRAKGQRAADGQGSRRRRCTNRVVARRVPELFEGLHGQCRVQDPKDQARSAQHYAQHLGPNAGLWSRSCRDCRARRSTRQASRPRDQARSRLCARVPHHTAQEIKHSTTYPICIRALLHKSLVNLDFDSCTLTNTE